MGNFTRKIWVLPVIVVLTSCESANSFSDNILFGITGLIDEVSNAVSSATASTETPAGANNLQIQTIAQSGTTALKITFSQPVKATNTTDEDSALNPANYKTTTGTVTGMPDFTTTVACCTIQSVAADPADTTGKTFIITYTSTLSSQ